MPLDDPRSCPGCCSANWDALLGCSAHSARTTAGEADVATTAAGRDPPQPGLRRGQTQISSGRGQPTLPHEIRLWLQDTTCGAGGTPDRTIRQYESYPAASIGETGATSPTDRPPASTFDYMSYCGRTLDVALPARPADPAPRLGQDWLRDDLIWDRYVKWREYHKPRLPDPLSILPLGQIRFEHVIAISGLGRYPEDVDVLSVARVAAMGQPPGRGTELLARLLRAQRGARGGRGPSMETRRPVLCGDHDDRGKEADTPSRCTSQASPAGGTDHQTAAPDLGRRAPASEPSIGGVDADRRQNRLAVSWERKRGASQMCGSSGPETTAQRGTDWPGVRGGSATFEAGPCLWARADPVLLHDGFSTTTSEPVAVELRLEAGCGRAPRSRERCCGREETCWRGHRSPTRRASRCAGLVPLAVGRSHEIGQGTEAGWWRPSRATSAPLLVRDGEYSSTDVTLRA